MNVSGDYRLSVPPERVWRAIHDVGVLRQAVPDCQELQQTSPDTYAGSAKVGVAVIKGLYKGTVRLTAEREPEFLRIVVDARSSHAQITGEGSLALEPDGEGTLLRYEGSARIHGPLASVGQRLMGAASKMLTEQFFKNLENALRDGEGS